MTPNPGSPAYCALALALSAAFFSSSFSISTAALNLTSACLNLATSHPSRSFLERAPDRRSKSGSISGSSSSSPSRKDEKLDNLDGVDVDAGDEG